MAIFRSATQKKFEDRAHVLYAEFMGKVGSLALQEYDQFLNKLRSEGQVAGLSETEIKAEKAAADFKLKKDKNLFWDHFVKDAKARTF